MARGRMARGRMARARRDTTQEFRRGKGREPGSRPSIRSDLLRCVPLSTGGVGAHPGR